MSDIAGIKAGEAYVSIMVDNAGLNAGLIAAGDKINEFAGQVVRAQDKLKISIKADKESLNRAGQSIKDFFYDVEKRAAETTKIASDFFDGYAKSLVAHGAAIAAAAAPYATFGDQLDKMSGRTGMSTQYLSEMSHVANLCGTNISAVEQAVKGVQEKMLAASKGSKEVTDALAAVGVSYKQLASQSPEQQFKSLVFALSHVEDKTLQGGLAMRLFGESGRAMMNIFSAGSDAIDNMAEDARTLGVTLDGAAASKAAKLTDCLYQLKQSLLGVSLELGKAITPALIVSADALKNIVIRCREGIKYVGGLSGVIAGWSAACVKTVAGLTVLSAGIATASKVMQVYARSAKIITGYMIEFVDIARRNISAAIEWGSALKLLATNYDTIGTAANMLLGALRLPIDSRANQIAAGLLLMSNAETAATARSMLARKWESACAIATAFIARLRGVSSATTALSAAEQIATVRLNAISFATSALTIAKTKLASVIAWTRTLTLAAIAAWIKETAVKAASTVASFALAIATKGLAGAFLGLSAVLTAICAHPVVFAIAAIGVAIATLVIALRQACTYTAQLSNEQEKMADKELKRRQTDLMKFNLLKSLATKDTLNDKELARAKTLTEELRGKYGDIGFEVDEVKKKLTEATDAQEKFNASARKQATDRLDAQIAEEQKNLDELRKTEQKKQDSREGWGGFFGAKVRNAGAWATFGYVDTADDAWQRDMQASQDNIEAQQVKLNALKKQKESIAGGNTAAAFGADTDQSLQAEIDTAGGTPEERADKIKKLDAQIAEEDARTLRDHMSQTQRIIDDNNKRVESYQAILAARIKAEEAKPEKERDKEKIAELQKKIESLTKEKDKFAETKTREEESQKILDTKKRVEEMERHFADEIKTDLEKTLDTIQRETDEYRKQLELLKDQLSAKNKLSDSELAQLNAVQKKLKTIDQDSEARKERAREADLAKRKQEKEKPDVDEQNTLKDQLAWNAVVERMAKESREPYEKKLKAIKDKEDKNIKLTQYEQKRKELYEKRIKQIDEWERGQRSAMIDNRSKLNAAKEAMVDAQKAGDIHAYKIASRDYQQLDRERIMFTRAMLRGSIDMLRAELKAINKATRPEAYKDKQEEIQSLEGRLAGLLGKYATQDGQSPRQSVVGTINNGLSQFEFATKQGASGSFSAFEAAEAGRRSWQEMSLNLAKQQIKYLRDIKDNTEVEQEAKFA